MMERNDRFVRREFLRNLFPIMFSVLGGTINTLIDTAFVSHAEGQKALASISLCMPIYLVLCVVGVLLANGSSTLSAREIGKNKPETATKIYFSALAWNLIVGVVLTGVGMIIANPIANVLAHGGELAENTFSYAFVTIIGTIPTIILYMPIRYLQLEGKGSSITAMMMIMIVADVLLDYVFLYPLAWGVRGAALASVLSTLIACIYGFIALQRGYNYKFSIKKLRIFHTKDIVKYGAPAALGNLLDALRMMLLNNIILTTLGAPGVAIWAVLNSLAELSITISSGVPQAAAPIIGMYYPSKENAPIRSLMRFQFVSGIIMMGIYSILLILGNNVVAGIFAVDPTELFFPLVCLVGYIMLDMIAGMWVRYMNTIGSIGVSTGIMTARKLVFAVAVSYILVGLGEPLWLFLPISAALTLLMGLLFVRLASYSKERKIGHKVSGLLLLDDHLEVENKILDFSIGTNPDEICEAAEKIQHFCELNEMDVKLLMKLSLSIEELLTLMSQHIDDAKSVDLRAFALAEETGIQIRMSGKRFDPFTFEDGDAMEMMGVNMLKKMANETVFYYALGMNTLHIFFQR